MANIFIPSRPQINFQFDCFTVYAYNVYICSKYIYTYCRYKGNIDAVKNGIGWENVLEKYRVGFES